MRLINTSDLFKCARLLTDSGIKDEFKKMYAEGNGKLDAETFGVETVFRLITSLTTKKAEKQIYTILGDICEKTPEEIEKQHIDILMQDIDTITEQNDISGFFKRVARLIN